MDPHAKIFVAGHRGLVGSALVRALELAHRIAAGIGFAGAISTDPRKPDGTPRKLLDISKLTRMGWKASIELDEGIDGTYRWFLAQHAPQRS